MSKLLDKLVAQSAKRNAATAIADKTILAIRLTQHRKATGTHTHTHTHTERERG